MPYQGGMLSFFRKKIYPYEDVWTLATGTINNKQVTVRRNTSAASLVGHADYRYRVTVTIGMIDVQPSGLPTYSEADYLEEIEMAVAKNVEMHQDAIQVLSVTTDGVRDLIFHSRAPKKIEAQVAEIRKHFPYRSKTLSIEVDRRWRVFEEFAKTHPIRPS